jgi:hypothetical protein
MGRCIGRPLMPLLKEKQAMPVLLVAEIEGQTQAGYESVLVKVSSAAATPRDGSSQVQKSPHQ